MPAISHIEIRIASRATVEIGTTTAKPVRYQFRKTSVDSLSQLTPCLIMPLTKHQTSDVAFDATIVAFTITPVTLPNRLGIDLPPVPAAVAQ